MEGYEIESEIHVMEEGRGSGLMGGGCDIPFSEWEWALDTPFS